MCMQRAVLEKRCPLEAILADVIHTPLAVIVPPLPIIRTEGDAVLTSTTVGLSHQVVAVPVEDRDPLPALKEPQAFRPPVMDAHPGRPVIGLEHVVQVATQDGQLSGIRRHGQVSSPEHAQFLCTVVDLEVLEDKEAFALGAPASQATWNGAEKGYYSGAANIYGALQMICAKFLPGEVCNLKFYARGTTMGGKNYLYILHFSLHSVLIPGSWAAFYQPS